MIHMLKFFLKRAIDRMKSQADLKRSDKSFNIGSWVWLKLHPYRQKTMKTSTNGKWSPRYFGPFKVLNTIGKVAYKLQLPDDAQIYPIIHVSQFKQCRGELPTVTHIPSCLQGNSTSLVLQPAALLEKRMVKRQNISSGSIFDSMGMVFFFFFCV